MIKLVKCKKCGTTVMTNTTLYDRLNGEKSMILTEIKKNVEREKELTGNALKKSKANKVFLYNKLGEVNSCLKQLRHQTRESERDVHEVLCFLLSEELKKCGYTKEQINQYRKEALEIHRKRIANAQKELERLYGSLN